MPMRRIVTIFVAALTVAWGVYTAYWFHAQGQMRKGLEHWAEQRRADGWQVTWSGMESGGYPTHLRLTLAEPALTTPSGISWRAERLSGATAPFNWTVLHVEAAGQHHVETPQGGLDLNAASARADLNLDRHGALQDITVLAAGLTITGPALAEPVDIAGMALAWDPIATTQPIDHTKASVRFSVSGHGIRLPALPGLPLDRDIALAELTGQIMGAIPPGPPAQALAAWAADGGTLEIEHVSLEWAPMALEGSGTVALDPRGQPLAAMATNVRGFAPLMDRLAQARAIDTSAAQAAKVMLMILSKPDSKGRPAVPVPLSVQDGVLSLGPAAVARVPSIQW